MKDNILKPPFNKKLSQERKTGSWRYLQPIIDSSKCLEKCTVCLIFCPDIAITKDKNGKAKINYDYCKGCGICAKECPQKAITLKEEVL